MKPEAPVVSVTIAANATTGETGEVISFLATPTNGGDTPSYEWFVNDVMAEGIDPTTTMIFETPGTYTVYCKLYSSLQYLQSPATSNTITIVIS
jgi:plastocyanin